VQTGESGISAKFRQIMHRTFEERIVRAIFANYAQILHAV